MRRLLPLLLLLAAMAPQWALATHRALVVGVEKYANLDGKDLYGPTNDAALIMEVLAQQGFEPGNMTELSQRQEADARPTRKNIIAGLEALATEARDGDFVYLHFAGHGTRQPSKDDLSDETDGLDELFLPEDAGKWDGSIGSAINVITDNDLGGYLDRIRDRGANVWVVFDSCHSGTMTRGNGYPEARSRNLRPAELGIPDAPAVSSRGAGNAGDRDSAMLGEGDLGAANGRGYLVAFSAAQSTQETHEFPMPRRARERQDHGLFTYSLMEVLARHRGITYNQLGLQVLESYRVMPYTMAQPLISGSDLDIPIFDQEGESRRFWRAGRVDEDNPIVIIEAGQLHGFTEGSLVNLYSDVIAGEDTFIGRGTISMATTLASEARLEDIGAQDIPRVSYAVMVEPAIDFTLSVGLAPVQGSTDAATGALRKAIDEAIETNPMLAAAARQETADLRVSSFEGRIWVLTRDQSLPCEYQALDEPELEFCRQARPPQDLLHVDYPRKPEQLTETVNSALTRIARGENIVRMQAYLASGGGPGALETTLEIARGGKTEPYPVAEVPVFGAGDRVIVNIENVSTQPQDVSIIYRDARYGIVQLWPRGGEANRIQQGDSIRKTIRLNPNPEGLEDLIILGQPGEGIVKNFAFLQQKPLGMTSRGSGDQSAFGFRGAREPGGLQLLMDTAAYANEESAGKLHLRSRGATMEEEPELGSMQIYRWEVRQ